jgi:hypothetical protein
MNSNNNSDKPKQLPKLEYVINQPTVAAIPSPIDKSGYLAPPPPPLSSSSSSLNQSTKMKSFSEELEDKSEKRMEHLKKLAKYNPLVPIGCLVTIGVLGNGILAMKNKDKNKSQRMMRYRVGAQGITVIALVIGTMATQFLTDIDSK